MQGEHRLDVTTIKKHFYLILISFLFGKQTPTPREVQKQSEANRNFPTSVHVYAIANRLIMDDQ